MFYIYFSAEKVLKKCCIFVGDVFSGFYTKWYSNDRTSGIHVIIMLKFAEDRDIQTWHCDDCNI
jgi:hypothetical protein